MQLVVVDCENFSAKRLKQHIRNIIDSDIVLVIGSRQNEEDFRKVSLHAEIVKCCDCHKDASDLVIVAVITKYMITNNKYSRAVIISDDTGFDSAIHYLRNSNIKVTRQSPKRLLTLNGLGGLCGYIANNFESGVLKDELHKKCKDTFSKRTLQMIKELQESELITESDNRIYFKKLKLKEVAKRNSDEAFYNSLQY